MGREDLFPGKRSSTTGGEKRFEVPLRTDGTSPCEARNRAFTGSLCGGKLAGEISGGSRYIGIHRKPGFRAIPLILQG